MKGKSEGLLDPIFGNSLRVRILEALLIGGKTRVSVRTLTEEAEVGKSETYRLIIQLLKEGIVREAGKMGNKQMYELNFKNEKVEALDKFYKLLLLSNSGK